MGYLNTMQISKSNRDFIKFGDFIKLYIYIYIYI